MTDTTPPFKVARDDAVFIPLENGRRIAATIWRPVADLPVSVVVEMIPYRRRDGTIFRDWPMHVYTASHGIAYCRIDLAGSGDSDGLLLDEYTVAEQLDACAVIAWLAAQDWCSGNVGMTGISWGGFNALQVAARRPPALKAIITLCSTDDRYNDDVHYMGGCLLTEDAMWSAFMLATNALPPDPQIVGERWREMWHQRIEANRCWSEQWLEHQRRDAYWKQGSVIEDYAAIDIPVYAVGGWQDSYSNAIPRLLAGLKSPRKALIGPWSHQYPCNGSPGPLIGYLQEALRWWRHWLDGETTGIMDEPMLRAWIYDPALPIPAIREHVGRWVTEPAWPSPHIEPRTYHLNAGRLGEAPEAGPALQINSPVTAGRDCGRWGGYGGDTPDLPTDQRREDGLGLTFETTPFAAEIDLLGAPVLELQASADVPRMNVTARLAEIMPDGTSAMITWGVLNLTHRNSHETPESLVPGATFAARLQLNDIGRRIPAGSRLRLVVSTQHWPILWPQPAAGTLTLVPGTCRLTLPFRRPGTETAPPPFPPAERAPEVPAEEIRATGAERQIRNDIGLGEQQVELAQDYGRYRILPYDLITDSWCRDVLSIRDGDPLSAQLDAEWRIGFQSGEADVEVRSFVTLSADATDFLLSWRVEAAEAGQAPIRRSGERRIPRDFI